MIPQVNQIYRHFKGNLYKVITIAVHTETEEELVIYQALYGDFKIYARPLSMFMSEVDKSKYPDVAQKMRFEPIEQMVGTIVTAEYGAVQKQEKTNTAYSDHIVQEENCTTAENTRKDSTETDSTVQKVQSMEETVSKNSTNIEAEQDMETEETVSLDPLLEAYLDTDSYRERLNILHGLQHRITEHMLNTMAIVIDFELPEGDLQEKYYALNDCLLTKEKYECNRIF